MFFGMGFCTACAIGAYLLDSLWLLVPALISLILAVVLFYLFRESGWQRKAAFVALGLAVGMCWFCVYGQVFLQPPKSVDGKTLELSAALTDYSDDTDYGVKAVASVQIGGRNYRCILYLDGNGSFAPGDVLHGDFCLHYTGINAEKENEYYSSSGIFLIAYQRGELRVERDDGRGWQHFPARLRKAILLRIERLFPADTSGFAKALLLGDRAGLDYETKTALTVSGIVHVVSVSGLHISILLSVLFLLLGRRRFITPVLGGIILFLAAAVTGFSASVVRSCLMNGLLLLALMWEREYDPLTAVAFALLVMLGINPLAVTSVGLQLSAASVIGIHLFAAPVSDWIRRWNLWADARPKGVLARLRDGISSVIGVSTGATVATSPLTALSFGTVSLVGWVTNLLVLWLVNMIFVGILLCVIVSLIWHTGGVWLAALLSIGVRVTLWVAKLLSAFPLAAVYTQSPYIAAWLVFVYAMLAVFLASRKKRRFQLFFWSVLTLIVAITFSWLEPRTEDFRMTAVDVGQGQCILLQSDGRTYMVDCGGNGDEKTADQAVAALHSQGIFRMDGLILTHYDRDHTGGAAYLLSRMAVEAVYLPAGEERADYAALLEESGVKCVLSVDENTDIIWENTKISLFAFGAMESTNESSLCILFEKENYDILITGDQSKLGEMVLLQQNRIPQVDVLVVGHHGANSSTGDYLLSHIRPAVAVISVGEDNRYGHPSVELLKRLENYGCQIRRTDIEGTIIIKR